MQYHIHQVVNPTFSEDKVQIRRYAGFVEANSLEDAYLKSQNDERLWNPGVPCRSTSIGDVIQDDNGFHLVVSNGFEELVEDEPCEADYFDGDAGYCE